MRLLTWPWIGFFALAAAQSLSAQDEPGNPEVGKLAERSIPEKSAEGWRTEKEDRKCWDCRGSGKCLFCRGTGRCSYGLSPHKPCPFCKGTGRCASHPVDEVGVPAADAKVRRAATDENFARARQWWKKEVSE